MRILSAIAAIGMSIVAFVSTPASAEETNRLVPANMIGLLLTPTGFDNKIYEPGLVDIGRSGWLDDYGNRLILIQRSGFAIKEQFGQNDPNNANDREDHRCIVGPNREPMTLDVRLLFALPDYKKPEGKNAILRMGLLGNPRKVEESKYGSRVWILDAESVYEQQVRQQVRGKIRDVCLRYQSVEDVFKALEKNGQEGGFTDTLRMAVGTVLAENQSPLFLVGAVASNVKPDPTVVAAVAANQAAAQQIAAITTLENFLKQDPTGLRNYLYKMMAVQGMAGKGGNSTVFMTDVGANGTPAVPLR